MLSLGKKSLESLQAKEVNYDRSLATYEWMNIFLIYVAFDYLFEDIEQEGHLCQVLNSFLFCILLIHNKIVK